MAIKSTFPCFVSAMGWPWFGLLRVRIYFNETDYRTLWGFALWKFSFYVAIPAFVVNAVAGWRDRCKK